MHAHSPAYPQGATRSGNAFTRLELLSVLAAVALLGVIAAPVLATPRQRSDRVLCANNLRQIGAAMQLWANDHGDAIPQEVTLAEGGTFGHPLAANAWLHFSWLSNELTSPRVLFCPSDQGQPAHDFSGAPTGGYLHPNFANRATSYLLSHPITSGTRDVFSTPPFGVLAADRNVRSVGLVSCSRFNAARYAILSFADPGFSWDTNLHDNAGNVLSADGRVAQVNNEGLRAYLKAPIALDSGGLHFIVPR